MSPRNYTERLFLLYVARSGLPQPSYGRTPTGILYASWQSPCAELGALTVYVDNFPGTTLSCHLAHTHYEWSDVWIKDRKITRRRGKKAVVVGTIERIKDFLNGTIVISDHHDSEGTRISATLFNYQPTAQELKEKRKELDAIHKTPISYQYYNWFGPYSPKS